MFKRLFGSNRSTEEAKATAVVVTEPEVKVSIEKGDKVARVDNKVVTAEVIHKEFMTAADIALEEAKRIIAGLDNTAIDKANRLKNIGFGNAAGVATAEEHARIHEESSKMSGVITRYSSKYVHKFISEADVIKICQKYGLLCGPAGKYIGHVPLKNLKEMEQFRVNNYDVPYECYLKDVVFDRWADENYKRRVEKMLTKIPPVTYISKDRVTAYVSPYDLFKRFIQDQFVKNGISYSNISSVSVDTRECKEFLVCAPEVEFDTKGTIKKGEFLTRPATKINYKVEDPVVLQRVNDGFLIVTAWGPEASDPLVVNQKMN